MVETSSSRPRQRMACPEMALYIASVMISVRTGSPMGVS